MRKNLDFEAALRRIHHDHYKQKQRRARQAKRRLRHDYQSLTSTMNEVKE